MLSEQRAMTLQVACKMQQGGQSAFCAWGGPGACWDSCWPCVLVVSAGVFVPWWHFRVYNAMYSMCIKSKYGVMGSHGCM